MIGGLWLRHTTQSFAMCGAGGGVWVRPEKKPQISCTLLMNKGLGGGMVAHSTPKAGVEWGTQQEI